MWNNIFSFNKKNKLKLIFKNYVCFPVVWDLKCYCFACVFRLSNVCLFYYVARGITWTSETSKHYFVFDCCLQQREIEIKKKHERAEWTKKEKNKMKWHFKLTWIGLHISTGQWKTFRLTWPKTCMYIFMHHLSFEIYSSQWWHVHPEITVLLVKLQQNRLVVKRLCNE